MESILPDHDRIGLWSEVKLEIVRKYAVAYSQILTARKRKQPRFRHIYIDAFAGPGVHFAKATGEFVQGSPLNALNVTPPFDEIHLIDASEDRTRQLRQLAGDRQAVHIYAGDCNDILISKVFPRAQYTDYARALCLLDPYDLNLSWELVKAAGQSGSIEIFINFMIMDANRNALRRDPSTVLPDAEARMTRFWGDESWREESRKPRRQLSLLPEMPETEKASNDAIAEAYRQRLLKNAGFKYAPQPVAMKNKAGATIYYLYFASPNPTGHEIVTQIFDSYRNKT
jgi:three-Cys-motif partner protein